MGTKKPYVATILINTPQKCLQVICTNTHTHTTDDDLKDHLNYNVKYNT